MADVLSASQVEAWLRCQRYWAWTYIAKLRSPSTPSQIVGTTGHEIAENWLRDGTPPPRDQSVEYTDKNGVKQVKYPGLIFEKGMHHWPAPGIAQVEREIFVRTPSSDWTGFVDVTAARDFPAGDDEVPFVWVAYGTPGSIPLIGDHKFTADLKYAKTESELRRDPQFLLYAAHAMAETGSECVDGQWLYYPTSGKAAPRPVRLRLNRDDIRPGMEALDRVGADIWRAYDASRPPLEHNHNSSACQAYGGCPHIERCNLSDLDRMRGYMSGAKKGFAELIAEQKALAAGGGSAGDPVARATADGWQVHPSDPNYLYKGQEVLTRADVAARYPAPVAPPPLNPPEAPPIVVPPIAPEVSGIPTPPPVAAAPALSLVPTSTPDEPNRDAVLARAAQLGIDVPKGQRTQTVLERIAEAERGGGAVPSSSVGSTLYVDCIPVGEPVAKLSDILAPLAAKAAAALGVPHYSMGDFGKGPGAFAAVVAAEHPAMPSSVIAESSSSLYRDARASLRFDRVVQGTR